MAGDWTDTLPSALSGGGSSGWGSDLLTTIGGSLIGGAIGNSSANKVNKAYQKAMEDVIRQAGVTTGQISALYSPYSQYGGQALNALAAFNEAAARGDYSAITEMPEYKFALQQGQSDLARNLAARGGLFGGQAQKQFMDYNQALAGNQIQNYLNRLTGGINVGLSGAQGQAQGLTNYLNTYGEALGIKGQAEAGKAASQGSNWKQAVTDIGKAIIGFG
jgi:hypothetical protein